MSEIITVAKKAANRIFMAGHFLPLGQLLSPVCAIRFVTTFQRPDSDQYNIARRAIVLPAARLVAGKEGGVC